MTIRIAAALVVALLGLVACDGDDGASVRDLGGSASSGSGSGSGSGTEAASGSGTETAECEEPDLADPSLDVRLDDYEIRLDEDELTSGPTRFRLMNVGEVEHEFVIVAANSLEGLPLTPKGSVDEEKISEQKFIAEVEGIPAGEACALKVDLEPGTYVLFCNIRERGDDGVVNHFLQGMRTRVKVS